MLYGNYNDKSDGSECKIGSCNLTINTEKNKLSH